MITLPVVSTSGAQSTVNLAAPVVNTSSAKTVGGLWYAIGAAPTDTQIASLSSGRYQVLVLNAWEAPKMRQIKQTFLGVKVLVYKCFSSARNYSGAVINGVDATYLPTGVGYVEATNTNPNWFALSTAGQRIQWGSYPGHWQMSVWDAGYQQRWASNVVAEVVREGWDGVLADNDYRTMHYYSSALLAGTTSAAATDQKIRDGLDALLTTAGQGLNTAGKLLVPNVSETRLFPGRWTSHARFGGAMEEHLWYAPQVNNSQFNEMVNQSSGLTLLVTSENSAQTGFVQAALVGNGRTTWQYTAAGYPPWTAQQDLILGAPLASAVRATNGVWWREFTKAWVAFNPGSTAQTMTVWGASRTIPAADSLLLTR